eukprot:gb/GECH01011186.1/.p1 GENE.gb/GECH01011186.1/~~gb/GECH01011186.1/.p1  ORF type:complete len:111 (+),score=25.19 gb/GECH01011186.1/:1-333(+)
MTRLGIRVGPKKGHPVTKLQKQKKAKPTKKKRSGIFAKELVREVGGFSPYERRTMELIRTVSDKRVMRFAKKRLGTNKRAKHKVEELRGVLRKIRAAQQAAKSQKDAQKK